MSKRNWVTMGVIGLIVTAMVIGYVGCGGGGSSSHSAGSSVAAGTVIIVSGALDDTSIHPVAQAPMNILDRFCSLFQPNCAYAIPTGITVDQIIAIGPTDIQVVTATANFSLTLHKDQPYIIVFLDHAVVQGLLKLDAGTDLDALPLSANSNSFDLGTVAFNAGLIQGSIVSSTLFTDLGISDAIASAFGIMDKGMLRWCTVDADQNGVLDFMEGKSFQFGISYGFTPGEKFNDITSTNYSSPTLTAFHGYRYGFGFSPANVLGFAAVSATMHSPAMINGANDVEHTFPPTENWQGCEFYSGDAANNPATPPIGDYVVTVTNTLGTLSKAITFLNVSSITIISPTLYNVYVPSIKLTVVNGKVTTLAWKWWKNTLTGWVNPSAEELNAVLDNAAFEVARQDWDIAHRAGNVTIASSGDGIPFATEGSIAVPPQSNFAPGAIRFAYTDKAGYGYGFEWDTN